MMQEKLEEKDKLKVLTDIAEEVNSNENAKIEGIENDALVVVSDIEGRAKDFLVKLKHTGVIDRVDVNKETGKLKICLNENFCGTIDFCGDLTAYKVNRPFGNEIVTEVFEELLTQIKEHNKDKEKDKRIQFVAVPGNHEFYRFWGRDDGNAIYSRDDGGKNPLLIKLKSLKVIAEIQKYFLEQVRDNNDDITDNDYQYQDIDINERIKLLDNECKMLDTIYNALSDKGIDPANYFDYFINYESKKKNVEENKENIKNNGFLITTKGGKIVNENDVRYDEKDYVCWREHLNKADLQSIFQDDNVCVLPFDEILKILKSNGKGQENSGECTEWTEDLINEKLNDLKSVLDNENFTLDHTKQRWSTYNYLTDMKDLETKLESFEVAIQKLKQELSEKGYITEAESKDENPISLLRPLFWDKSALLSKIVFNHRGKKFRTLHHFGLFVPNNCSVNNHFGFFVPKRQQVNNLNKDNQNEIFANAFLTNNQFNIDALGNYDLRYLKRDIFKNNKIPTLFGHEGYWNPKAQTQNMYCVDNGYDDGLNVVCVVDSKNQITPYYTHKCIENKNREQNVVNFKLGDFDKTAVRTLAIYDCKLQNNISIINNYVESGQQSPEDKNIVNAIDAIIKSNYTLEDYHRHFAFSQKDRRAQQVYQTYKMLAEPQNELNANNQQTTMIELNGIHSINTPCGSCL